MIELMLQIGHDKPSQEVRMGLTGFPEKYPVKPWFITVNLLAAVMSVICLKFIQQMGLNQ